MREYFILTATFTAPFALLGLLNVLPDLSLRNIGSRGLRFLRLLRFLRISSRPCKSVCPRPRRFNPITTERR